MFIAALLSQKKRTGLTTLTLRSSNNGTTHLTSLTAADMDLYSASAENIETVSCFLVF